MTYYVLSLTSIVLSLTDSWMQIESHMNMEFKGSWTVERRVNVKDRIMEKYYSGRRYSKFQLQYDTNFNYV